MSGKPLLPRPCLMLVTEPHPNLVEVVKCGIAGGVNIVQLRSAVQTGEAACAVLDTAQQVDADVRGDTLLLINYWYWLVRKTDADGAHLPETGMFTVGSTRSSLPHSLIGQSVHTVASAINAEHNGADYLVAGTVYASQSHPELAPQGLEYLRAVCASVTIPVIAIGGITPARVAECIEAGAAGVAVLSPIMRVADPEAAARAYWNALQSAWEAKQCT